MALLALWFGVSVPLTFVGAYFGFRKPSIEQPVRTNQIPRQIPDQSIYTQVVAAFLLFTSEIRVLGGMGVRYLYFDPSTVVSLSSATSIFYHQGPFSSTGICPHLHICKVAPFYAFFPEIFLSVSLFLYFLIK